MKKSLSLFAALLLVAGISAQDFVSTEPSNRNVLIEEYTGVNCQYCPDGHRIANEVMAAHPGHAWAINIHTGMYAARYTTQWGAALADQTGLEGYPAGTVNRHVFANYVLQGETPPHTTTDIYRGFWPYCANDILGMSSPVNLAARATIDARSRVLTVQVEAYYTAGQQVQSNFLNVALLQNNVFGSQSGAQNYYPENVVNGYYRHMHMLRDLLTGQWGEEITTIGEGTLVTRTYRYAIPYTIGDVSISDFADLDVVAFITETHQEVLTAAQAEMTIQGVGEPCILDYKATLASDCSTAYESKLTLSNPTSMRVTDFLWEVNGVQMSLTDTLAPNGQKVVTLPEINMPTTIEDLDNIQDSIHIRLLGHTVIDAEGTATPQSYTTDMFSMRVFQIYSAAGPFTLDLAIDHYGNETTGHLVDVEGCTKPLIFGPYTRRSENYLMPARHIIINFSPAHKGLYLLRVKDADGMTLASDETGFRLSNAEGEIFFRPGGFTKESTAYLFVTNDGTGTYGIDDVTAQVQFGLYPNPAVDRVNIESSENVSRVEVLDMAGRTVATYGAVRSFDVSGMASGMYLVRVLTESGIGMQKFVKE